MSIVLFISIHFIFPRGASYHFSSTYNPIKKLWGVARKVERKYSIELSKHEF